MPSSPKHKIICKNLQDIIKDSLFSTKRNSIQQPLTNNNNKRSPQQRTITKSQPRQKRSSQRCNTSGNATSNNSKLYESGMRVNTTTSVSKHSLKSKEKINVIDCSRAFVNDGGVSKFSEVKKSKHSVLPSSAIQFYPSSLSKKTPKQTTNLCTLPQTHHTKSLFFNQVDAIFTELQDFIRQMREKICLRIDFMSEESMADKLADQLRELSNLFRNELLQLVNNLAVQQEVEPQVLKPKSRNIQNQEKLITKQSKASSTSKSLAQTTPFHQQLIKIEQFMQRQNTLNSTILNSSPNQQPTYIPTQTDTQLLSLLVYKNKISNTKRKIQNTFFNHHGQQQQMMGQWVKSGRSVKNGEEDYSFRKGNNHNHNSSNVSRKGSREKDVGDNSNNSNTAMVQNNSSMKKKKNKLVVGSEKSMNKENRQKSIYQIVLEENRKSKGLYAK